MFELSYPWLLLALPLPLLVRWRLKPLQLQSAALKVPFLQADNAQTPASTRTAPWRLAIAGLIWIALLVAAAKPLWVGEPVAQTLSGRDLMLALDLSESMGTRDMAYQGQLYARVDVVKSAVSDFVASRQGDRLGLILFGERAYVQAPLTFDLTSVRTLTEEAFLGIAGNATAIGDAIALAVKRLQSRPEGARVLILLTDGQNTAGDISPDEATQLAEEAKVRVYTIGVASDLTLRDGFGFFSQSRQASADLDETTLKSIAERTGGRYFRARDLSELSEVYDSLNQLEPLEQDTLQVRPQISLMHWPLGLALALSALLGLLALDLFKGVIQRRFNRRPA